MSLLRRVEPKPEKLLERLLEQLYNEGLLSQQIEKLLNNSGIRLSKADRDRLRAQPVEFLLGQEAAGGKTASSDRHERLAGTLNELKRLVSNRLLSELDLPADPAALREQVQRLLDTALESISPLPSRSDRQYLLDTVLAEVMGYGPLEPLLADEQVHEILVMGPRRVYVTRSGHRERAWLHFDDEEHLRRVIDRLVPPQRPDKPVRRGRMADGSQVLVFDRPAALTGPALRIFRRSGAPLNSNDLIRMQTLPHAAMFFLDGSVREDKNIVICGGDAVGKSSLLNVLANSIRSHELIVTVEDMPELQLKQEEVLSLQSGTLTGDQSMSAQELLRHALRLRPGRLIVGEITGPEACELIPSPVPWLTTINSKHAEDALEKLVHLYLRGDELRTPQAAREQVADAVDIVVQMEHKQTGRRRVTGIYRVEGLADGRFVLDEVTARPAREERSRGSTAKTTPPPFRRAEKQPPPAKPGADDPKRTTLTMDEIMKDMNDLFGKMQQPDKPEEPEEPEA